jgi:hypothetical protein
VQKCEHDLFEERRANDVLERQHVEGDRDRKAGRASLSTQRVCHSFTPERASHYLDFCLLLTLYAAPYSVQLCIYKRTIY